MNRREAELILQALTGGQIPEEGDTLVRARESWRFSKGAFLGAFDGDPDDPREGEFWFNSRELTLRTISGGRLLESPTFRDAQ